MEAVRAERSSLPLLLLILILGFSVSPSAATWDLVLLHTNDVHARVEETSVHSGKCGGGGCYAGVARRATMIRKIRASGGNVLLLDAGDQFQGTVWFNYYKGAEAAHFMNELRYDAMVFGNHEFDNGVEGLMKPFMENIRCPVLSANIRAGPSLASTFGNSFLPYKIFTVGDQRVGVVGYTSRETPALSKPGPDVEFQDEVSALQPQVDKLLTLGVNKIVALGHSGFTVDQEIARRVRGVDVVIGGHTNTFLYTGTPPSTEVPAGPYPFMVRSDDGREVPVVQAYAFGKYLGQLKVTFDDAGNVVKATGNPILLDSSVSQDPDVLADVEEWKKNLANFSAQVVGSTLVFLNGTTGECRFRECNLGNLICDAMIDNNIKFSDGLQWNHVTACIANGGGVRTSIDERTRNGSVTMEDLISVLPFGGTFDLVQLKGSTLRSAFEHSVHRYGQSTGEFLQVSGFQVEFDLSKPAGSRVKSLNILCSKCRVPRYEPVEDDSVYKVVLPSYLVTGGDGFSMIPKEMLKHNSGDLDISVVAEYIKQRRTVYPAVEGRIRIYNSASGLRGETSPLVLLVLVGLLYTLYGGL
ncbi:5'-nucleotidase [Salarias fasciatus]|uniref:5'-nucleotidase n=1 Tax=Salarias fasciatus TaxID=181472 RepID=A0A672FZK8_SALFA|nr:5'-nucleotidase [Salarias fasciatus]